MGSAALAVGAGAGLGLLKEELIDGPRRQKMNEAQAEITRQSYLTGMRGQIDPGKSPFDAALQGGFSGLQLAQAAGAFKPTTPGGVDVGSLENPTQSANFMAPTKASPFDQNLLGVNTNIAGMGGQNPFTPTQSLQRPAFIGG